MLYCKPVSLYFKYIFFICFARCIVQCVFWNTILWLLNANENSQYTGGHPVKVMPNWDYLSTLLWPVLTSTCFFTWLSLALSVMRELGNLFICIQYTKRIKRRGLWGVCASCVVYWVEQTIYKDLKMGKKSSEIVYRFLFRMNTIGDIQNGHCRRLLGVLMWGEKKT